MPVTTDQVDALRRAWLARPPEIAIDDPMRGLDTQPVLCAFVVATARARGLSEADQVELLCRAAEFTQSELRECVRVLAPLGYDKVASRLRELVRSAKRGPRKSKLRWPKRRKAA